MSKKGQSEKEHAATDRRDFLRRFFKRSAPLVVGAVAKPLENLPGITPPDTSSRGRAARMAPPLETVTDDLKKEFEDTHEEFVKNNPDFFELP